MTVGGVEVEPRQGIGGASQEASLNWILKRYVQDFKHELRIMDEDEDSPDEVELPEVEEIIRHGHTSIDTELIHGGGGSNGMVEDRASSVINTASIASFAQDLARESSHSPDLAPGTYFTRTSTSTKGGNSRHLRQNTQLQGQVPSNRVSFSIRK